MTAIMPPHPNKFSIVSAVHNVDPYLRGFFLSLERQTYGLENLDIILVDDGSTDDSLSALHAFAAKYPNTVRVLAKENGGQASARNLGLEHSIGEWVTFTDPDDFLDENYFAQVAAFLLDHTNLNEAVLATSITMFNESSGSYADNHPLQNKFRFGDRLISLDIESDCIQLSAATALFNRERIESLGLRFSEEVRPNFEDGHFIAKYLLAADTPQIGAVASARYNYRKRARRTSTLDLSQGNPDKLTVVPKAGYLALLQEAAQKFDTAPAWLQTTVVYDLAWIFKADSALVSASGAHTPEVLETFHRLVAEIRSYLSEESISAFRLHGISDDLRFVLLRGYVDEAFVPTIVRHCAVDIPQQLVEIRYRFTGELPREEIYSESRPVAAEHQKIRSIEFLGRVVAKERIIWVPLSSRTRVRLNSQFASFGNEVSTVSSTVERHTFEGKNLRSINSRLEWIRHPAESLESRFMKRVRRARKAVGKASLRGALGRTATSVGLHNSAARKAYGNAWVFMDRKNFANDNAEHLYRYVRTNHPEVNAWFVLERDSPDWGRLRADGFRLVEYGTWKWKLLLWSADHCISSHIDAFANRPLHPKYGQPRWRFTFLQHGVTKDDLSRWLNPKTIDLFVTASHAENDSIATDLTPYRYTSKEVRLTGFPRHDALLAKRESTVRSDLILVMPTWRRTLLPPDGVRTDAAAARDAFLESRYAAEITGLLDSPVLAELAARKNLQIVFMPHPNMAPYLAGFPLAPHVQLRSYADTDVQEMVARAALLITDYSSLAFEAAVIGAPVTYFQFDQDEFFAGGHPYRKGYFDYERNGFGPVCLTLQELEETLPNAMGLEFAGVDYAERMRSTFAHHDQQNSRRVYEAILALNQPSTVPSTDLVSTVA